MVHTLSKTTRIGFEPMSVIACFVRLIACFRLYHLPEEPAPDVFLWCLAAPNPPDLTQKDSDGERG